jgi:hypothetical protein
MDTSSDTEQVEGKHRDLPTLEEVKLAQEQAVQVLRAERDKMQADLEAQQRALQDQQRALQTQQQALQDQRAAFESHQREAQKEVKSLERKGKPPVAANRYDIGSLRAVRPNISCSVPKLDPHTPDQFDTPDDHKRFEKLSFFLARVTAPQGLDTISLDDFPAMIDANYRDAEEPTQESANTYKKPADTALLHFHKKAKNLFSIAHSMKKDIKTIALANYRHRRAEANLREFDDTRERQKRDRAKAKDDHRQKKANDAMEKAKKLLAKR